MNNVIDLTIKEAFSLLSIGKIKSYNLVLFCIQQIKKYNDCYKAFLIINEKVALLEAQSSDLRYSYKLPIGLLDGIPIGIKDNINIKNFNTTASSKILGNYSSSFNSTVIQKLKRTGGIILGKVNCDEFAMGSSSLDSAYQVSKNPYDVTKTPGGSSGGSAVALRLGMCLAVLGTDTGGSIRQPASFNNLVGLRPTYGRISRYGLIAYSSTMDQIGVISKSIFDALVVFRFINGCDLTDSISFPTKMFIIDHLEKRNTNRLKIGIPNNLFFFITNEVISKKTIFSINRLKSIILDIDDITLPSYRYSLAAYYTIVMAETASNLSRYDGIRFGINKKNTYSLYHQTRGEFFGLEVKKRIMLGNYILSSNCCQEYYYQAQQVKRMMYHDFYSTFNKVDVIIIPTTPMISLNFKQIINNSEHIYKNDILSIGVNLSEICSLTIPCGFSINGLPIGIQVLAKQMNEEILLSIAYRLEIIFNLFNYTGK